MAWLKAFQEELQRLGWEQGRNIQIELRSGGSDQHRLRASAAELVGMTPDVLFANATPALVALNRETRSLPIVFVQVSDPVKLGFVANLARPGGNITGFANFEHPIGGKWLELLKDTAPGRSRVAVILDPDNPSQIAYWQGIEAAAPSFMVQLTRTDVRNAAEIERAISAFAQQPNSALLVAPNAVTIFHRNLIIALAAQHVDGRLSRGDSHPAHTRRGRGCRDSGWRGRRRARQAGIAARRQQSRARSLIGMVVRAGAAKPDISSVETLRSTLLAAKSIAYSDSGSGAYLSTTLLPKLGIADEVAGKSRKVRGPPSGEPVAAVVARGEAEIGFQQVSELIHVPGISFVGAIPAEVQPATFFAAALTSTVQQPQAASALIRFLASPEAAPAIAKAGLKPPSEP